MIRYKITHLVGSRWLRGPPPFTCSGSCGAGCSYLLLLSPQPSWVGRH